MKKNFLLWIGVLTCSLSLAQIPSNGLLSYHPFTGNAIDLSGNGYNGTVNGASLIQDRLSNPNSAYSFNGSNSNITLSNIPITGSGDWSIAFWFKTSVQARQALITLGDESITGDCVQIYIYTDNKLHFDLAAKTGPMTSTTVTDGSWHFGTVTIKSGKGKIYLNGLVMDSVVSMNPNITNAGSKFFGRDRASVNTNFFNGNLDDIRIYNRSLQQSEINILYNEGSTTGLRNESTSEKLNPYPNPTDGLVNLNLGEEVSVTIFDASGVVKGKIDSCSVIDFNELELPIGLYNIRTVSKSGLSRSFRILYNEK